MPPSAMTGVFESPRRLDGVHDGGELRHADAGDDAGGADRARPDADLDGVGAGIDERLGALGGRDVAGHHLHRIGEPLDALDRIEHAARMAVGGVHDDEVDARLDQPLGALVAVVADRGRGRDPQPALLVLAGMGMGDRLLDVLDGDQPDAAVLVVHHQELFDAVLVQQALRLLLADAFPHRHQAVLGHQLGDLLARIGCKAHVTVGEDADQAARRLVAGHHRHAGDAVLLHQRQRVGEGRLRMNGEWVHHHAGLEFLDPADQRGLLVRLEVAVDNSDAAGLRHGNRHGGFGHGVHRGGDDRNIERDVASNPRADVDLGRQNVRKTRRQQHVVEGECFARTAVS